MSAGVPVVVLAGRVDLDASERSQLAGLGIESTHALLDLEPDLQRARERAAPLLRELASRVLTDWLVRPGVPTDPSPVRSSP
jgi:hypothetical protein